jgi:2-polyprenyl-6-methoxyphenol hydroxylase-like FAD-dependent oxidoreductase
MGAGVLLDNLSGPDDINYARLNPVCGRFALVFPQGEGRARAYLLYERELDRLQGEADFGRFVQESVNTGMPADIYAGTRGLPPLASFDMTETWVDHPYRDGLALIGDAAGSSDPTWGQGLSLTLRDVRILSENLLSSDDWDSAGHAYATDHDKYFNVELTVGQWFFDLFLARGNEADECRMRALPLIVAEPERVPDHAISGPDLPFNDEVRKRFHGET